LTSIDTQQLAGKHAFVTGGGRGIGLAISRVLLSHGARVTMTSRSIQAQDIEQAMQPHEINRPLSLACDVTDPASVARAFAAARERFGPVHILVNNAGQAASAPFLKTDFKLWRQLISVNLDGAFHCTHVALPDMLNTGWGRIVNVASIAGLIGQAYITAYCASKHALVGLTRALAVEVAAKGITVNAVCPGYTDSDMVKESIANIVAKTGRTSEQALNELIGRNPLKRLIKPEEVANAVAWLCLPGSEAATGQAIVISGGEV
jgi:NAD(P)-dependent dehydrogenase (short-subunit alcohol dehydrogenase family)